MKLKTLFIWFILTIIITCIACSAYADELNIVNTDQNKIITGDDVIPVNGAQEVEPIYITISYNKDSVSIGEEITATYSISGGSGSYSAIAYNWEEYSGDTWIIPNETKLYSEKGTLSYTPTIGCQVRLYINVFDSDGRYKYIFGNPIAVSGAQEIEPISISISYNKNSVSIGEEITATYSISGGSGSYTAIAYNWEEYSGDTWIIPNETKLYSEKGTLSYTPTIGCQVRLYINVFDSDGRYKYIFGNPIMVTELYPAFGTPDFRLPMTIKHIEESAFEGLPMSIVEIPSGCESIDKWTFKDCTRLTQIRIPASVTTIDSSAFEGVKGLTIFGTAGSEAEIFSKTHSFTFVPEP